ncbi:hypothetical protein L2E82_29518 [Cichorium intybus]|uniref:Uncharacterized protein n=1 Tax=Cichorium intybus TaxID=13427 RepID=A0ACB9CXS1_CICIN|nr:hypothetical protein L2E82_29518 [Cichorium intybus]
MGKEEDEDEWEEGEIHGEDEAHEVTQVPESGIHGNNFDGDKVEEEGHEEDSRPNSKPNETGVPFEVYNENVENDSILNDVPLEDTRDLQNIEYQNTKEGNSQAGPNTDPGRSNIPCAKTMESDKNKKFQAQFRKSRSSDGQEIVGVVEVQIQGDGSDMEDRSDQDRHSGTHPIIDLDGVDSSHSIDLKSEPVERYDWHDVVEEDLLRHGKSKKSKNKDKRSKKQANAKSSTFPVTMKPKDVLKANAYRKNKKVE